MAQVDVGSSPTPHSNTWINMKNVKKDSKKSIYICRVCGESIPFSIRDFGWVIELRRGFIRLHNERCPKLGTKCYSCG